MRIEDLPTCYKRGEERVAKGTVQARVIETLKSEEKPLSVAEMRDLTEIRNIGTAILQLEKKGWLKRSAKGLWGREHHPHHKWLLNE